jgi:hypothetical protein
MEGFVGDISPIFVSLGSYFFSILSDTFSGCRILV